MRNGASVELRVRVQLCLFHKISRVPVPALETFYFNKCLYQPIISLYVPRFKKMRPFDWLRLSAFSLAHVM